MTFYWHFNEREVSTSSDDEAETQKLSDTVKLIDSFLPCHAKAPGIAFNLLADTYESCVHVAD